MPLPIPQLKNVASVAARAFVNEDVVWNFTVLDAATKLPKDLTGFTLVADFRSRLDDPTGKAPFTGVVTLVDAPAGKFKVAFKPLVPASDVIMEVSNTTSGKVVYTQVRFDVLASIRLTT